MIFIAILFAHYVADFPAQVFSPKYMGQKHSKLSHLLTHVAVYTFFLGWLVDWNDDWTHTFLVWLLINGLIHFCVDYLTSKATHYLWDAKRIQEFFCVIGFDQFLHVSFLFYSSTIMGLI